MASYLALSIREITPFSVTFILSPRIAPTLSGRWACPPPRMQTLAWKTSASRAGHRSSRMSLQRGLSVKVNGIPWQRVLNRIDEETDEVVIILFGLMPGRQYDVELEIVPGERTLRGQITTDSELHSDPTRSDQHTKEAILSSSSLPSSTSSQGLSISPSRTSPYLRRLETRRQQLAHELSALNNEQAQLIAALKTARKEAQKADAGLRAEIDVLKRSRPGHGGRAAGQTEEAREEIEAALPGPEQHVRKVDEEFKRVRVRAEEKWREREEAELREKRGT
ncbi:hypothetical protein C8Q72DRAFT_951072 [Fomitopsis betulina]|nr:hypothetical protein C8Q72DRAFT_951072 [Fomitopsis betulina]